MNLAQLLFSTRSHLNDVPDPTVIGSQGQWSDAELTRHINASKQTISQLSARADPSWELTRITFQTAPNIKTYSLPLDLQTLSRLERFDPLNPSFFIKLSPLPFPSFDELVENGTGTGCPYFYLILGKQIVLFPIPDKVYDLALHYTRVSYPLAEPGDEPADVPAGYHDMIPLLAAIYAAPKFNVPTAQLIALYGMRELSLIRTMNARASAESQRIQPWYPDDDDYSLGILYYG